MKYGACYLWWFQLDTVHAYVILAKMWDDLLPLIFAVLMVIVKSDLIRCQRQGAIRTIIMRCKET